MHCRKACPVRNEPSEAVSAPALCMKVLQEKGLMNSNMSFSSLAAIGEETFKSKFIDCHMDSVPGLADAYAAARAGIIPSRV